MIPQVAWADGENELRLAVGLVGLYGLRPAELAVLTVKDGKGSKGRVGHIKRNSSSMSAKAKPHRLVLAIDVPGLGGKGLDCWQCLRASN